MNYISWIKGRRSSSVGMDRSLSDDIAEHRKHCKAKPGNCPYEREVEEKAKKEDEADNLSTNDAGASGPWKIDIPAEVIADQKSGSAVKWFDDNVKDWREEVRGQMEDVQGEASDDEIDEMLEAVMPIKGKATTGDVMGEVARSL